MNQILLWRRRKRYTIAEAAQFLDCSPEDYRLVERGVARSNNPAVRALENELRTPYSVLKKETMR